jgi:hypothetical protein
MTPKISYSISTPDLIDSMFMSALPEKHTFENFMNVEFLFERLMKQKAVYHEVLGEARYARTGYGHK